jgi:signal peptidase II
VRYAFWAIGLLVVVLDQWTKHLVQTTLPVHSPTPVIPGFLWFTHTYNPGVAFGQFAQGGPLLVFAAIGAAVGIVWYRAHLMKLGIRIHPLLHLGLALPLGGALGNVIDRIRIGKVVDFIDLGWFPIFNVADSAITLGALALVSYFTFVNQSTPAAAEGCVPAGDCSPRSGS